MVKIVLSETDIQMQEQMILSSKLDGRFSEKNYANLTTKEILEQVSEEGADRVVFTKDSRFLLGVGTHLLLKDIYIYHVTSKSVINIMESSKYVIEPSTDVFRLYELGEFTKYPIKALKAMQKQVFN